MKQKGFITLLVFLFAIMPLLGTAQNAKANDTGSSTVKNAALEHSVQEESNNGQLGNDQDVTVGGMKVLIEQFAEEGEFENDQAVHALKLHLTAVGHFEKQDKSKKAVKHMKGFKVLLDHQKKEEVISKEAYNTLKTASDALIKQWTSLQIVKDGEAHAVVVTSEDQVDKTKIPHWKVYNGKESNGVVELDLDTAHNGGVSAKLNHMKFGSVHQSIDDFDPGSYEFKAHYYTASKGNAKIRLEAHLRGENGGNLKVHNFEKASTSDTAGEWATVTEQVDVPETIGNKKVDRIQLVVTITDQQDTPVYVDDVLFHQEDKNDNLLENPGFEDINPSTPINEFVTYVNKSTGATLPVVTKENLQKEKFEDDVRIYIGQDALEDEQICKEVEYDKIKFDGFAYCTQGSNIAIAGKMPRGTLYGVYYLLDHFLGVKWYSPDYTYVPKKSNFQLTESQLNQVQEPRFKQRDFRAGSLDDPYWRQHNMLNGTSGREKLNDDLEAGLNTWSHLFDGSAHNLQTVVSNDQYWAGSQLKMMDENVRRIAAEYFIDKLKNDKGYYEKYLRENHNIHFGQEDKHWDHPDPASLAFAEEHGNALAAPMFDMVIDVAKRVRKEFPHAKFTTFAYDWSNKPPKGMEIPDYVTVEFAPNHADFGRSLTASDNVEFNKNLKGWHKISNNVVMREYRLMISTTFQPNPNIFGMGEWIQDVAEQYPNMQVYYIEGDYDTKGLDAYKALRGWVASRLMWNPDQDYKKLIKEWVNGYFGDAGPYMNKYITELHKAMLESGEGISYSYSATNKPWYDFDVMYEADKLFGQATDVVQDNPEFLSHVKRFRIGVDFVILLNQSRYVNYAQEKGIDWNPKAEERFNRFKDTTQAMNIHGGRGPGNDWGTFEQLYNALDPSAGEGELGGNLLKNSGFEELKDDLPVSWRAASQGEVTVSSDEVHKGSNSIKITDSTLHQNVKTKVEGNKSYQFSGWIKCEDPRQVQLKVELFHDTLDSAGYLGGVRHFAYIEDEWGQQKMDVIMPSEANKVQVFLITTRDSGTCYFDDASFNKYQ